MPHDTMMHANVDIGSKCKQLNIVNRINRGAGVNTIAGKTVITYASVNVYCIRNITTAN